MLALLIDGESLDASLAKQIVDWAVVRGRLRFAHVFGDFNRPAHAAWCSAARQLNIKLELTQPPTPGKNAADIALAIKAMDLFHTVGVRDFIIAAHDRDYIPLALRLREGGARLGLASRNVDEPMRQAFDDWHALLPIAHKIRSPVVAPKIKPPAEKGIELLVERFRQSAGPDGILRLNVAGALLRKTCPELLAGKPKSHAARRTYEETKLFDILGAGTETRVRLRTVAAPTLAA